MPDITPASGLKTAQRVALRPLQLPVLKSLRRYPEKRAAKGVSS